MAGLFKRGDYRWASRKVGRKSVRQSMRLPLTYPRYASAQSESDRTRSFNVFMVYLGADADKRLDKITPARCRAFMCWALERVSRKLPHKHLLTQIEATHRRLYEMVMLSNFNLQLLDKHQFVRLVIALQ